LDWAKRTSKNKSKEEEAKAGWDNGDEEGEA